MDNLVLSAGVTGIAGVVWLVRLEGRINTHDSLFAERKLLADSQHEDTTNRLERIEHKIDDALLKYGTHTT